MERTKFNGIVYSITNFVNQKKYIGITTRPLYKRISEHLYDSSEKSSKRLTPLHCDIKKYGFNCFNVDVIEQHESYSINSLWDLLCSREVYYIQLFETNLGGYNLTSGGMGCVGYHHSDYAKSKISKTHRGKTLSPKHIEAICKFMNSSKNPHLGKKLREETKIKIGKANKGKLSGKNNPMYGVSRPDLSKRNIESGIRVCQIDISSGQIIKVWNSLRECARSTGWNRKCIADCCNGISKQSHGFVWKYEEVITCNT